MTFLFWAICGILACGLAYWLARPLLAEAKPHRFMSVFGVLAGVPLLALGTYLYLGNPTMPDTPLSPRLAGELQDLPPAAILARLENELRQRPNDEKGWRLLARLRATLGEHDKAADSWQRLLDLNAGDSEAQIGLAVALIEQQGGVVNEVAVALLDAALAVDSNNVQAQFWRAEAWVQQGRKDKARFLWQRLRADLPDAVPLAKILDRRLSQ